MDTKTHMETKHMAIVGVAVATVLVVLLIIWFVRHKKNTKSTQEGFLHAFADNLLTKPSKEDKRKK